MKFTPVRRKDGWLFCLDENGQPKNHDVSSGGAGPCGECGKRGLTEATSTHMNSIRDTPLLCLPCAQRYKELYEAGFFALETIVGA